MKHSKKIWGFIFLLAAVLGGLHGLYGNNDVAASEAQQQESQALPVEAAEMKPEAVQIWSNFSGHVVAVDHADIRPQVSGRITEIRFEDGQYVNKDDVLIVIDPRPYKAELEKADAALQKAKTQATLAEKEYQRAKSLIATEAISQSLLDSRLNNRQAAASAVQEAQAAAESAKINLDYAYVKAPISGKVSRAEITEGNLVQAGTSAPLLTSIVAEEKVYVDFEVDEQTYINTVRNQSGGEGKVPVLLRLNENNVEYNGFVHSFDNRIDPSSGTIRARAIFDNEDKLLLPGMSVSVLMGGANEGKQILVSERAIGTDQDRKFVYIIGEDGTANYREIKIGKSVNGRRVVISGLSEGDQVITEGIVRIRPGMAVSPKTAAAENMADMPTAAGNSEHQEMTKE